MRRKLSWINSGIFLIAILFAAALYLNRTQFSADEHFTQNKFFSTQISYVNNEIRITPDFKGYEHKDELGISIARMLSDEGIVEGRAAALAQSGRVSLKEDGTYSYLWNGRTDYKMDGSGQKLPRSVAAPKGNYRALICGSLEDGSVPTDWPQRECYGQIFYFDGIAGIKVTAKAEKILTENCSHTAGEVQVFSGDDFLGVASGDIEVPDGDDITFIAIPNPGFRFVTFAHPQFSFTFNDDSIVPPFDDYGTRDIFGPDFDPPFGYDYNLDSKITVQGITFGEITDLRAYFAPVEINLTSSINQGGGYADGSGTLDPTTGTFKAHSDEIKFTATPSDTNNDILGIKVTGSYGSDNQTEHSTSGSTLAVNDIFSNLTVDASFHLKKTCPFEVSIKGPGTVNTVKNPVPYNDTSEAIFTPNDKARLIEIQVRTGPNDGAYLAYHDTSSYSCSCGMPANGRACYVTGIFVEDKYKVNISAGSGGEAHLNSSSGESGSTIEVYKGTNVEAKITANPGNRIKSLLVDGAEKKSEAATLSDGSNNYLINSISANHSVSVTFEKIPRYTVTYAIAPDGDSNPRGSGTLEYNENDQPLYFMTPPAGYKMSESITGGTDCSGNWQPAISEPSTSYSFQFNPIKKDCSFYAGFEKKPKYKITVSASSGGSVFPSEDLSSIEWGSKPGLALTPGQNYKVDQVSGDGTFSDDQDDPTLKYFSFNPVKQDEIFTITFKKIPEYEVTMSVGPGGSSDPPAGSTALKYKEDEKPQFAFSPQSGYLIDKQSNPTCPGSWSPALDQAAATYTYSLDPIRGNCSITVAYTKIPTFKITISGQLINGRVISMDDLAAVQENSQPILIVDPSSGYKATITGDGVTTSDPDIPEMKYFKFNPVTKDQGVTVSFDLAPVNPATNSENNVAANQTNYNSLTDKVSEVLSDAASTISGLAQSLGLTSKGSPATNDPSQSVKQEIVEAIKQESSAPSPTVTKQPILLNQNESPVEVITVSGGVILKNSKDDWHNSIYIRNDGTSTTLNDLPEIELAKLWIQQKVSLKITLSLNNIYEAFSNLF